MSKIMPSPGFAKFWLLAIVAMAMIGLPLSSVSRSQANSLTSEEFSPQDPYGQDPEAIPNPFLPFDEDAMPRRGYKKAVRKKSRPAEKGSTKKTDSTGKTKKGATGNDAAGANQLKFSTDIAPILVANCTQCHSGDRPGLKKGKLDLSTFATLKTGTPDHKVISPGNPAESSLVLRIKGEETPRMPQGANQVLSEAAIAKVERWVQEGAKLDTGIDAKKPLASYAASADQVRRADLARLPVKERDKKIEAVGRERWKKANPQLKPALESGEHFVMFSNLPRDRAANTLKQMETQYGQLKKLLGPSAMEWVEKVSLYVFSSRKDLIEFVRAVETRELDAEDAASARFSVEQPYVAVVDPLGGKPEDPAAARRRGRSRRGEDGQGEGNSADRTLNGLLAEAVDSTAVASAGNPPRWLVLGIGSYLAAQVEPRSVYYRQLRQTALANFQQGWQNRANEAMGGSDRVTPDGMHAIGFALVEAMMSGELSRSFPAFVTGMLEGGEKLDEILGRVYRATREDFINDTGEWVAARYGQLQ
jgi:mono/diheme cytochrome c family protein